MNGQAGERQGAGQWGRGSMVRNELERQEALPRRDY